MFFLKSKRPSPTGSGNFTPNIRWWFWDDAVTPGLMLPDAFDAACKAALTENEWGRLCSALVRARMASARRRWRVDPNTKLLDELFKKVDAHLKAIREKQPHSMDEWIISKWMRADTDAPMLDVLKAYLNILEMWGYLFSWQLIKDARDKWKAMLLLTDSLPTHFILEDDIREINGRPNQFSVWINGYGAGSDRIGGGNWHFDYESGSFELLFVEHESRQRIAE